MLHRSCALPNSMYTHHTHTPNLMLNALLCTLDQKAMSQLCAIDIAHSKVLGDVPILGIGWAAPKVGNSALAGWVRERENLRILRIKVPIDSVANSEFMPSLWWWWWWNDELCVCRVVCVRGLCAVVSRLCLPGDGWL